MRSCCKNGLLVIYHILNEGSFCNFFTINDSRRLILDIKKINKILKKENPLSYLYLYLF